MEVKGKIIEILEVQTGTSKGGKEWQKQTFVIDTSETYNNIKAFDVFGDEKVANLTKYNNVGDTVNVSFDFSANKWENKYFTSINAWRIEKVNNDTAPPAPTMEEVEDDLPF